MGHMAFGGFNLEAEKLQVGAQYFVLPNVLNLAPCNVQLCILLTGLCMHHQCFQVHLTPHARYNAGGRKEEVGGSQNTGH